MDELLPSAKLGVEEARRFLREFRRFTLSPPLQLQQADVNVLIRAAAQGAPSAVGVTFDLDDRIPVLWCDPGQIKYCFAELVTNASECGATCVSMASRFLADSNSVEVTVSDSGPGIPEGKEEEIFEPLVTTKEQGTGLGLSIVRNIVQHHGGTVTATNSPGSGACFVMRIPILKREELENHGGSS